MVLVQGKTNKPMEQNRMPRNRSIYLSIYKIQIFYIIQIHTDVLHLICVHLKHVDFNKITTVSFSIKTRK